MKTFAPIVILTGAGISAESGIRTFRASDGLWEEHRIEDVATPEGFARDPALVHRFYNERRRQLHTVQPNAAHVALARLEAEWEGDFLLVTQNIDDLHERAGSRAVLHMHGRLLAVKCTTCERDFAWTEDLNEEAICPGCARARSLRPDVVWFGEMPYQMERIEEALDRAEIFIAIGTSGHVYPAAGFARRAWRARRFEINLGDSQISSDFHEHRLGPATREVPSLVNDLLTGASRSSRP